MEFGVPEFAIPQEEELIEIEIIHSKLKCSFCKEANSSKSTKATNVSMD